MLARNLLEFAEEGLVLPNCSDKAWMLSVSMRRSEDDFPSLAELACIGNCLQGEACHGCARSVMHVNVGARPSKARVLGWLPL